LLHRRAVCRRQDITPFFLTLLPCFPLCSRLSIVFKIHIKTLASGLVKGQATVAHISLLFPVCSFSSRRSISDKRTAASVTQGQPWPTRYSFLHADIHASIPLLRDPYVRTFSPFTLAPLPPSSRGRNCDLERLDVFVVITLPHTHTLSLSPPARIIARPRIFGVHFGYSCSSLNLPFSNSRVD